MQNLAPANGTEVVAFSAMPGGSFLDVFVNEMTAEGHQIVEALRSQPVQAPAPKESYDNVPSFAPGGMAPRL